VLDSTEAVQSKVGGKLGTGIFGKAAAVLAKQVVTESRIAPQIAEQLTEKIPQALEAMGIITKVVPKFRLGALVVLQVTITDIRPLELVAFAKGEVFAEHFQSMLEAFRGLGLHDKTDQVKSIVQRKVHDALVEKLAERLPPKLAEQGVVVSVVAKASRDQAAFFFDFIAGIQE